MQYEQKIRQSPLYFRIKPIAVDLAKHWFDCAKLQYASLSMEPVQSDDNAEVFRHDLLKALSDALHSVEDKPVDKKSVAGWSHGFVCGHIEGALNILWTNRYLLEPSNDFKGLIRIKTLLTLLQTDDELSRKIQPVYQHFLRHFNSPFDEAEPLPENVIPLSAASQPDQVTECRKGFEEYFSQLLLTRYLDTLDLYKVKYRPNLFDYISQNELADIVGQEHFY